MSDEADISKEGMMRKRGTRRATWGERHFVLRGRTLYYYAKATDTVCSEYFIHLISNL